MILLHYYAFKLDSALVIEKHTSDKTSKRETDCYCKDVNYIQTFEHSACIGST